MSANNRQWQNQLPPMPLKQPMTDSTGMMTGAWSRWFTTMFSLIGTNVQIGSFAPTSTATASSSANAGLSLSSVQSDLSVGRQL